jgi:hypothetical protein
MDCRVKPGNDDDDAIMAAPQITMNFRLPSSF